MSDTENNNETQDNEQQAPNLPVMIHAQYLKDISFENPNSPQSLRPGQKSPEMDMNINIDAKPLEEDGMENLYEVELTVKAEATRDDKTVFIAELVYGAAVSLNDIPQQKHKPLLFIEVPRVIFPFARQVLANVTQSGGYPPLLLNPVDFRGMYFAQLGQETPPDPDDQRLATAN